MSVNTSAGSLLHVSAAAPATFDGAGYAAVIWSPVGEAVDLGDFGKKFALIKHNPVATRGTQKFKGSFDEGSIPLKLALDNDDAGQKILQAASVLDTKHSFKITLPSGAVYYFQAIVMDFVVGGLTVDAVTSATVTLELTTTKTGIGVVAVMPV